MKPQRSSAGIAAILQVVASACLAAPAAVAAWSSDKALSSQLAPTTTVGKYQIQPPQGYTLQTQPGPVGTSANEWVGPTRADGTRPYLMLLFFAPPLGEVNKYTLKQVCAKMLAGVERKRKDWKQSSIEQGNVNGITFMRAYWHGTDIASGQPMSGFSYVARDGNTYLQLSSQDFTQYKKVALPLAEASALTFKKK